MTAGTLTATRRHFPPYARRQRAYVSWADGAGITDSGRRFTFPPRATLAALLDALPCGGLGGQDSPQTVYLVGELPARDLDSPAPAGMFNPFLCWCLSQPGAVWAEDSDGRQGGHYLDRDAPASSVLRFRHHASGRQLDLRSFTTWGTDGCNSEVARAGLALLERRLAYKLPEMRCLLASAAQSGLYIWQQGIPNGPGFPILPEDVRQLLHSTSGQGRMELFPPATGASEIIPALYALDGRFSYASLTKELGAGPVQRDTVDALAPYRTGWYHVTATIPRDWRHVGLLPLQGEQRRDGWEYPSEPGQTFTTWASDRELLIACWPFAQSCPTCAEGRRTGAAAPCPQHGWHTRIVERLLLQKGPGSRPLDTWSLKLAEVYLRLEADAQAGTLAPDVAKVASKACRAMLVGAIGSFHRTQRPRMRRTPLDRQHEIPAGMPVEPVLAADGTALLLWKQPARLEASDTQHPEWSTALYGRQRAAMLLHRHYLATGVGGGNAYAGMLTLPVSQCVAVRSDALYLTGNPGWPDDGQVGRMRLKQSVSGPLAWPGSFTTLYSLLHEEGACDDA